MHDGINFANIAEELVAEAFALARTFDEAGDVDKRKLCRDHLRALGDCSDLIETFVRNCYLTDVRLNRAEWIVRSLSSLRFSQCIKEGRFADVWQSDDPATETHRKTPVILNFRAP